MPLTGNQQKLDEYLSHVKKTILPALHTISNDKKYKWLEDIQEGVERIEKLYQHCQPLWDSYTEHTASTHNGFEDMLENLKLMHIVIDKILTMVKDLPFTPPKEIQETVERIQYLNQTEYPIELIKQEQNYLQRGTYGEGKRYEKKTKQSVTVNKHNVEITSIFKIKETDRVLSNHVNGFTQLPFGHILHNLQIETGKEYPPKQICSIITQRFTETVKDVLTNHPEFIANPQRLIFRLHPRKDTTKAMIDIAESSTNLKHYRVYLNTRNIKRLFKGTISSHSRLYKTIIHELQHGKDYAYLSQAQAKEEKKETNLEATNDENKAKAQLLKSLRAESITRLKQTFSNKQEVKINNHTEQLLPYLFEDRLKRSQEMAQNIFNHAEQDNAIPDDVPKNFHYIFGEYMGFVIFLDMLINPHIAAFSDFKNADDPLKDDIWLQNIHHFLTNQKDMILKLDTTDIQAIPNSLNKIQLMDEIEFLQSYLDSCKSLAVDPYI